MNSENYFLKTPVDQWSVKDAFDEIERNNPSSSGRENLQKLRDSITDAKLTEDENVVNTAGKLLKDWKVYGISFFLLSLPNS